MSKLKALLKKAKVIGGNLAEISEQEKIKKENKKKAQRSSIKPKGFFARKLGASIFWILFAFVLLFVLTNVFLNHNKAANEAVEQNTNKALTQEAVQYATDFSKELYTWKMSTAKQVNDPGIKEHQNRLQRFLATGLDANGGIDLTTAEYNSTFQAAVVKNVESVSDNLAHITLLVSNKLEPINNKQKKSKVIEKYVTISVAYDDKGKTFGIYDLPRFSQPISEGETSVHSVSYNGLSTADPKLEAAVNEFLPTFFKVYMEDTQDKLNYLLSNPSVTDGLNGAVKFNKISQSNVYVAYSGTEDSKQVIAYVFVTVNVVDPETDISFSTNYQLTVEKTNDRFIVSAFDEANNTSIQSNQDFEQNTEMEE